MAFFERIMLIDDDEITNYINENILNDLDLGKEVISYIAAEEALNVIKEETEHPLTLILLDLKMPVFDGFDFLKEYNQLEFSTKKNLKLVILTTSENPHDLKKLEQLGNYDVLVKPLSEENLNALL